MKNTNYKIGIYIRVSTQEQADNPEGSIKNQRDRLEQMVQLKNMQENFGEIIDTFIDEAKSGKDTNRPELKRMLKAIEKGSINLVMASELSRISRNIQDFAKIWNLMKDKGCSFFSLRENFDTTTAAGEMVLYTLANLSQFERRQVSERVSANFLARTKRGLFNGGPTPPGYKLIEGRPGYLEIDLEEAPIIKKCFEYFLKEETLASTAKKLNEDGFKLSSKYKGGKVRLTHFSVENLYRILTNKAVIGVREYKEFGEVHEVKSVWKGIVTKSDFYKVGKMLKSNKSLKKKASPKRYPYILTGLVYCLDCGDRLCGKSAHGRTGKIGYYEHGWRYRRDFCKTDKMHNCTSPARFAAKKVHEAVIGKIAELLSSKKMAKNLLNRARGINKKDPIKAEIKRYKSKVINLDRKLEVLTERLTELPCDVSASLIYSKMATLEKQKKEVMIMLEKKRKELKGVSDNPVDFESFYQFLQVFSEIFKGQLSSDEQGKLIRKLVSKIELGENEIKIWFNVGDEYIKKELAIASSFLSVPEKIDSSNLTYGGTCWTRTSDHPVMSRGL
jgi:site-specific DNA recombinase